MVAIDMEDFEASPTEEIALVVDDFEDEITRRYAVLPAELVSTREMPAVESALLKVECSTGSHGENP